ncbi:SH3 domain-containing protein [Streptomyces sp. CA2R106]|uniref:SH3 domain-containing protein n=1 Tax=Streptomyces sp. CA2R106 TaxID=3120153 RepID=UPI0030086D61
MYSAHARHRVTTGIAGLLIAGSGLLAAPSAYAAAPRPAVPADSAAGATTATSAAAPASAGQQTQATAEPQGRVVSRLPLTIREKATSNSRSLGTLQPGTVIWLHCKVVGQNVDGNKLWYLLGNGRPGYVAARYVQNLSAVPYCK